ncbi:MAG: serine/threonine protein kinase [Sandaracinaceae bacterium]|nr:serine/threonine protein kinase [Sandaracinaceae bacterium]
MYLPDDVIAHVREVSDEPDLSATKYRLLRPLGRGGMAGVYAVEDTELGREVALKVSTATTAERCARMQLEAKVIARLEHPGIVPVHDVGQLPDGRVYYVMKLVRGERLDRWARRPLERGARLRTFAQVCRAVAFAHAHGVIHRDLKPENVMVGPFGEALVMDWGLAKASHARVGTDAATATERISGPRVVESLAGATQDGTILGTPAYMPPEQARGEIDALDARADVYALGAILYFLLARRAPFEGETPDAVLERVRDTPPRALRELAPQLPRALDSICAKAMSRDREARYAGALELAADVDAFLDAQPVSAHREAAWERAARFASRHRVLLSLFGVYLAVRVLLALLAS